MSLEYDRRGELGTRILIQEKIAGKKCNNKKISEKYVIAYNRSLKGKFLHIKLHTKLH